MSDKKISQLPAASDTDVGSSASYEIPVVVNGTTKKVSNSQVLAPVRQELQSTASQVTQLSTQVSEFSQTKDAVDALINVNSVSSVNLVNKEDADFKNPGRLTASSGMWSADGAYFLTGFIPVTSGKTYYLKASGFADNVYYARFLLFYDSSKSAIQSSYSESVTGSVVAPEGASYLRVTFPSAALAYCQISVDSLKAYADYVEPHTEASLKDDSVDTDAIKDNAITQDKLADNITIPATADALVETIAINPKNLINKSDSNFLNPGRLTSSTGSYATNGNYFLTGFIPVTAGKTYFFNPQGYPTNQYYARFLLFYDSSKVAISSSYAEMVQGSSVAPEGAAYMRVTMDRNYVTYAQVSEDSAKPYEDYFAPYNKVVLKSDVVEGGNVKDGSITSSKLAENISIPSKTEFKGQSTEGDIANGGVMSLTLTHVVKNVLFSCLIDGTIEDVQMGAGYINGSSLRCYTCSYIRLTPTNVQVYTYSNGADNVPVGNPIAHGLTLGTHTAVSISSGNDTTQNATLRITTESGSVFETTIKWGVGRPFVQNFGTSSIHAKVSVMYKDLAKSIWCFGDSYYSYNSTARWPYYLLSAGFTNMLFNNMSGLSPADAYTDLVNLLTFGFRPTYLFWCLGMNGTTTESMVGGQYAINSYQKGVIDQVKEKCDQYGIKLVLATIPTVPARQKTGFNIYVKSLSNVRYVDFAAAVGADSTGTWYDGLLEENSDSNLRVHPTAAGAKVLYSRVLVDFPEITNA